MTKETVDYGESYQDIFLSDLDGYGKTAWGMTEDEVLRAETPRVERRERPGILVGGNTATLRIKEVRTQAGKFSADFIFEDSSGRLTQVNLTSLGKEDARESWQAFCVLKRLLTEKYGTPKLENGLSEGASWELGRTIIELANLESGRGSSLVVVCYKSTTMGNVASGDPWESEWNVLGGREGEAEPSKN
jgi:hypothetical protein